MAMKLAAVLNPRAARFACCIIPFMACRRRSNIDLPCRSNTDPGMDAGRVTANCG